VRRIAALAILMSVLAMGACSSLPGGVDGNLADEWAPPPSPAAVLPVAGACYDAPVSDMQVNAPTPCAGQHLLEVVKVGAFTGSAASATSAPLPGSSAMLAAFADCHTAATGYLGGEVHGGLLKLTMVWPDAKAWTGGARWYRCDLTRVQAASSLLPVAASGSVRGALAAPGPLVLSCIDWTRHSGYLDDYRSTPCAKQHNAEYAGAFHAPHDGYPSSPAAFKRLAGAGCEGVVARYLGLKGGTDTNASVGWAWSYAEKTPWEQGDRYIRCFAAAFTAKGTMTGTVHGIGTATAKS